MDQLGILNIQMCFFNLQELMIEKELHELGVKSDDEYEEYLLNRKDEIDKLTDIVQDTLKRLVI